MPDQDSYPDWSRVKEFLTSRGAGEVLCQACGDERRVWKVARDGEAVSLWSSIGDDMAGVTVALLVCANCGNVRQHSLEFIAREIKEDAH